jgi:beta-glucosidase
MLIGNPLGFVATIENYVRAHVAIYEAIKANDTIDADGDGQAALVGYTLNTIEFVPARQAAVSDNPEDVAAAARLHYVYNLLFTDSLRNGNFDTNLDGEPDVTHADWPGHLDFMGVQYYSRNGVTGQFKLIPLVNATPCFPPFDLGSCVRTLDDTHFIPAMGYEYAEEGLYTLLTTFGERWPDLPLTVTESGVATQNGTRRAEHVVRSLEQIARARSKGVDVRGYYHWSLMDNFEWTFGYGPRFGLYSVDLGTYERTATEGATVLGEIAGLRQITSSQRAIYGGLGVMTPETP